VALPRPPPGERGGPQQHPWEAGLAFTAGFLGHTDTLLAGSRGDDDALALLAPAPAPEQQQQQQQQQQQGAEANGTVAHEGPAPPDAPWLAGGGGGVFDGGAPDGGEGVQLRRAQADGVRVHRRFFPYPQPYGLGPALLEVQLWLLGKLLAFVPVSAQVQVLQVRP
jgi:hypothetical protein